LHTLRACYGANPRPDALMKEQLVEMTGLNPRVIRVWFQNKRCKDKKKNMLVMPNERPMNGNNMSQQQHLNINHHQQQQSIHHSQSMSSYQHLQLPVQFHSNSNNINNNNNQHLMFEHCF
jgi:hypothetical protein